MRVEIDKATLKRHRACGAAYISPEWDAEREVLVYANWPDTVQRLLASDEGVDQLEWLVRHKLVPMTESEFNETVTSKGIVR